MPIRLAQVGALRYAPGHVRLLSDPLEFQHFFPDEAVCARLLERIRWPVGFKCSSCSQLGELWRLQARLRVSSTLIHK